MPRSSTRQAGRDETTATAARMPGGHARRDHSLADYQHAVAKRLREHDILVDPAVFQSLWLLHESTTLVRRAHTSPALQRFNMTWTQFEVLLQLWLYGEKRMGDIAAAAVCNAALTDVVVVLSRRGYITRHTSTCDRRATLLDITSDGAAVVMNIIQSFNHAATVAPPGWKDDDLDTFNRIVQQLLATHGDTIIDVSSRQGVDREADAAIRSYGTERFSDPAKG